MGKLRFPSYIAIIGVLCLAGWAYAPGVEIPYYGDDFKFYFPAGGLGWVDHFARTGPTTGFYRPLQNTVLTLLQSFAHENTVPVHTVNLVLHLGTVGVVYEGCQWIGGTKRQALLGAALMAVAQANGAAVLGNDTMSQVGSALFGYLSLRFYGAALASGGDNRRSYGGALVLLSTSLLFKETGFAFVLLLVLMEIGSRFSVFQRGSKPRASVAELGWRLVPVLLIGGVYLIIRSHAGAVRPGFGTGDYQLSVGFNVVRNAFLFGAAATSVVSTPRMALWVQNGGWVQAAVAITGSVLFVAVVVTGVYRSGSGRKAVGLFLVAAVSLTPVILLNDVSELYVYTAMPPLCIIAGIGLSNFVKRASGVRYAGFVTLLVTLLGTQAAGVRNKAQLMKATGDRTQAILRQVAEYGEDAPSGSVLCLQEDVSRMHADTTAYSIYRMPGSAPLKFAEPMVRHRSSRSDIHFVIESPGCPCTLTPVIRLQLQQEGWSVERVLGESGMEK
jgi:hypothetical protein